MAVDHPLEPPADAGPLTASVKVAKPEVADLETRLGHAFADPRLIARALTHLSAPEAVGVNSYQRLEFLGDRVLGLAVSEMLYEAFPNAPEGDLSVRLARLVRRETCAEVAPLYWATPARR